MKRVFAIFLSFLSLVGIVQELAVYLSFKMHQEEITFTVCKSRNSPNNECQGSCYLENQLNSLHDHNQSSDSAKDVLPETKQKLTYFLEELLSSLQSDFYVLEQSFLKPIIISTSTGFPLFISKPPQVC